MTIKRNTGNNKKPKFKTESASPPNRSGYRNFQYIGLSAGLVVLLVSGYFIQSSNEKLSAVSFRLSEANKLNEQLLADLNQNKQQLNQLNNQMMQAQQEESEVARQIQNLASDFNQVQDDQASIRSQLTQRNAQIQKQSTRLIQLQNKIQQLTANYQFGLYALGYPTDDESLQVQVISPADSPITETHFKIYQSARTQTNSGIANDVQRSIILSDVSLLKSYMAQKESVQSELADVTSEVVSDIEYEIESETDKVAGNNLVNTPACEVDLLSNGWLQVSSINDELSTCINDLLGDLSPHHIVIQLSAKPEIDLDLWKENYPEATIQIRFNGKYLKQQESPHTAFLIPNY